MEIKILCVILAVMVVLLSIKVFLLNFEKKVTNDYTNCKFIVTACLMSLVKKGVFSTSTQIVRAFNSIDIKEVYNVYTKEGEDACFSFVDRKLLIEAL